MKVSRIYQPRNPLFWVMLALNLMSLVLGWVTHNQSLNVLASVLVGGFAIGILQHNLTASQAGPGHLDCLASGQLMSVCPARTAPTAV